MPDGAVELIGLDDAMRDLSRWTDDLAPAVTDAAEPFADRVADSVRSNVPHLTGRLAGSVMTDVADDGVEIGYDGDAPYDGWIEFGGSRGREYFDEGRYLYPTAQASEAEFYALASDTADDTIARFSWSTPSH